MLYIIHEFSGNALESIPFTVEVVHAAQLWHISLCLDSRFSVFTKDPSYLVLRQTGKNLIELRFCIVFSKSCFVFVIIKSSSVTIQNQTIRENKTHSICRPSLSRFILITGLIKPSPDTKALAQQIS